MDLLNFMGEETKEKLEENKSLLLKRKNEIVEDSQDLRRAEMETFKPEKLEKIKFNDANKTFGEKKKVCFFITEQELSLLKQKWKLTEQFGEMRIAFRDLGKFVSYVI